MDTNEFTVLVGSLARGSYGPDSDVDILRIGHQREITPRLDIPRTMPVSYIDYDQGSFGELYRQGSLFLHHAFTEGSLLEGGTESWKLLRQNFKVATDFSEAIEDYKAVFNYIVSYPGYEDAYVAYLSNMFKALKNIAIFRLAETGVYEFDKIGALSRCFNLTATESRLLVASNNSFERNCDLDPDTHLKAKLLALEWSSNRVRRLRDSLR